MIQVTFADQEFYRTRGVSHVNRLTRRLRQCRRDGRLFLVGFLPAGWPDRDGHGECLAAAFGAGADAMEISLPNPPRPLDGPLLQQAAEVAATQVHDARDALVLAGSELDSERGSIVALAYRHAAEQMPADELIQICIEAGADALLMPEHSFAEQLEFAERTRRAGLEQVLFLYLEGDLELLAKTPLHAPVIYLQSADLQTGGPFNADKAHERLAEVREALGGRDAFILVGFGIRGPEEVSALVDSAADGVIIGTALTEAAVRGPGAVADLVESVAEAVRTGAGYARV